MGKSNIEEKSDFIRDKVQEHTDKILDAINPVSKRDLPFIVYCLKETAKSMGSKMTEEQRLITRVLELVFRSECRTVEVSDSMEDMLKGSDSGGDM